MSDVRCYHCGLPVPANVDFSVAINGQPQAMCCPGCQAVAMAIVDGGLDRFYRYRSSQLEKPSADTNTSLSWYDLPEIQADFVNHTEDGNNSVQLSVKGITCSACAWLIEKYLCKLEGVVAVNVNVTNHRCYLVWNPQQIQLSQLLRALESIGYEARPATDVQFEALRDKENKQYLLRLGVAGLAMMQAGMVAIGLYAGDIYGIENRWQSLLRWVSFLLVTPVVFYSARPFFVAAWRSLRVKHLVMDVPVSLAISLAYAASTWATITNTGDVYFDSVSMFTFFLLLGRYLEMRVRYRNESLAYSFTQLVPPVAMRIGENSEELVPVKSLNAGDLIRVDSGATLPCDGEVIDGNSDVIEAILTGEQKPVEKTTGTSVSAGTVNITNPLVVQVAAIGNSTRLAAILNLADSGTAEKPARAALADRLAGWFVATVLVIALLVGTVWWFIDADKMLWVVLSVLVVTCPCALSLATPAALTVATSVLRSHGFLIRKGHVLETLAAINRCVIDKTGTLTLGVMKIKAVEPLSHLDTDQVLNLAAGLEKGSAHPIAKAFYSQTTLLPKFDQVRFVVGEGVCGQYQGKQYALGKAEFVTRITQQHLTAPTGDNRLLLANNEGLLAWISLEDSLRPGAETLAKEFSYEHIDVEILSGDHAKAVESLATKLNIQAWQGDATPADKLGHLQTLQQQGKRVMMVGDGINDVPVLNAADVSVAIGDATDLTRLHADSILIAKQLTVLPFAVKMARLTRRIIRQNLAWAVIYNVAALPLACAGLIPPWAAAIGMSSSSLLVVLNALRINRYQQTLNTQAP